MSDRLDHRLRQDLAGTVPSGVGERVQPHFAELASRLRAEADSMPRPKGRAPTQKRVWWWSLAGMFGAAGVVAALIVFTSSALRAEVEFVGILEMDNSTRFYLSDTESGTKSGWISLHDNFAGYTLTDYDPSGDVLTLVRNDTKTRISLRKSAVGSARIEIRGTLTFATGEGEPLRIDRATFLLGQDNILPLRDGARLHVTPTVIPENEKLPGGGLLYQFVHETPDARGVYQVAHTIQVVVLPHHEFGLVIGRGPEDPNAIRLKFEPVN